MADIKVISDFVINISVYCFIVALNDVTLQTLIRHDSELFEVGHTGRIGHLPAAL